MNNLDEDLFRRELSTRADDMGGSPLTLDSVRGKAGRIRRTRRINGAIGIAAAVALLVPAGVLVGEHLGDPDGAAPPTSQTPTPGPTPKSVAPEPSRTVTLTSLDVRGLPTGPAPRLAYMDTKSGEVHLPDGTQSTPSLPGEATALVSLADGRTVVTTTGPGDNSTVTITTPAGETSQHVAVAPVVPSSSRNSAAWISDKGEVMVLQSGAAEPKALTTLSGTAYYYSIGGIAGDDCLVGSGATDGGCDVYLDEDKTDGSRTSYRLGSDGQLTQLDDSVATLGFTRASRRGQVLGQLSAGQAQTCWGLFDSTDAGTQPNWKTCDFMPVAFSATGDFILASESYADGFGRGRVAVLNTKGDSLVNVVGPRDQPSIYTQALWEDESHVLVLVYQGGTWATVRIGVDGQAQLALAPVAGGDIAPYVLSD